MLTSDKQNVGKCINLQWILVSYKIDINAIHIETKQNFRYNVKFDHLIILFSHYMLSYDIVFKTLKV